MGQYNMLYIATLKAELVKLVNGGFLNFQLGLRYQTEGEAQLLRLDYIIHPKTSIHQNQAIISLDRDR